MSDEELGQNFFEDSDSDDEEPIYKFLQKFPQIKLVTKGPAGKWVRKNKPEIHVKQKSSDSYQEYDFEVEKWRKIEGKE